METEFEFRVCDDDASACGVGAGGFVDLQGEFLDFAGVFGAD